VRGRSGRRDEFRWVTARSWTNRWYPQGIDTGMLQGRRMLAVSWFRQDAQRHHLASRVTLIDLVRRRLIDVALMVESDDGRLEPARIHTGGLAWFGDRLFAAATNQGIWEFDLGSLRVAQGDTALRATGASSDRSRPLMPRRPRRAPASLVAVRTAVHPVPLRCSFIGRAFDARGESLARVVIGEFRDDDRGRIGEFELTDTGFAPIRTFSPGIPRMQGAALWGERLLVSQSDGLRPGTLWSGGFDGLERTAEVLPAGCQDLALSPETDSLWTLGEHPWRRVVRGIRFARLGIEWSDDERRLDG